MAEEIIDLLDNPKFYLWATDPNDSLETYWNQIYFDSPHKQESISKARSIVQALRREFGDKIPERSIINDMLRKIFSSQQ